MNVRMTTKLIHEGKYVAEIDVELVDAEEGWAPYLSLEDAYKLDEARKALQKGDTDSATKYGRVYRLTPV